MFGYLDCWLRDNGCIRGMQLVTFFLQIDQAGKHSRENNMRECTSTAAQITTVSVHRLGVKTDLSNGM